MLSTIMSNQYNAVLLINVMGFFAPHSWFMCADAERYTLGTNASVPGLVFPYENIVVSWNSTWFLPAEYVYVALIKRSGLSTPQNCNYG
eukprot:m.1206052 g.1206052  ORF g.1206052 m.1206052 type:complete len:89 (+) comp24585_c1_seq22:254-520(+)